MTILKLLLSVFLLTLFITGALSQKNRTCPSGQFFSLDAARCQLCPPGTFRSDRLFESLTRCNSCRAGTFNPSFGLETFVGCRLCYEDTFSERGSGECQRCPPGTIANRGASRCLKCGPGFAASKVTYNLEAYNPSKCLRCEKGTYSDGRNNRVCKPCPVQMTSRKPATSLSDCSFCPPGREAYPGSGPCFPCRIGQFKPGREGRCDSCPRGSISTKEGSKSCTPCPKGTRPNGSRQSKCVPCPDGTTTFSRGAWFCRKIGLRCPPGFFETKSGDCNTCRKGYRYNLEEKTCEKCAEGSVSRGRLQRECRRCPAGQQPDSYRRECICLEGGQFAKDGSCEKCPKGTFLNNELIVGYERCIKCRLGSFADERGSLTCKPCPPGTAASEKGSTQCERCGPDLMTNVPVFEPEEEGSHCVSKTTGCPLGWVREGVAAVSKCRRISCRVGTQVEDIGKVCVPCEPGQALDKKGTKCRRCPSDEVSDGGIITECKKCPNGLLRDLKDGSKCTCKSNGRGIQDGICKECPKGTSSLGRSGVCTKCEPGRYTDLVGDVSCFICDRDTVSENRGAKKCRKCPEGTVSNRMRGGTKCISLQDL